MMSRLAIVLLLLTATNPLAAQDQATEKKQADAATWRFRFASKDEARKLLATRDTFAKVLSPFDLDCRLRKADAKLEEWLQFNSEQAAEWTAEDREKLDPVLEKVSGLMRAYPLPLPREVILVKTTGKEESGAAYTRRNAIFLPPQMLRGRQLDRLMMHEVFHVLSRNAPKLRAQLYRTVGFESCVPIPLPQDLAIRKLTNPDAPEIDTTMKVTHDGESVLATPILLASADKYDPDGGLGFFQYLQFRMAVVDVVDGKHKIRVKDGKAVLLDPTKNADFRRQIGNNTRYIIHPDEILADNFVLLMRNEQNVPTPRILNEMKQLLSPKQ